MGSSVFTSKRICHVVCLFASLLLSFEASSQDNTKTCASESAIVTADFEAGGMKSCSVSGSNVFNVNIAPETTDFSDRNGWFAFKVTNKVATPITIYVNYLYGRYSIYPKISYDGIDWSPIDRSWFTEISENKIQLKVPPQSKPYYIAPQQILASTEYNVWMYRKSLLDNVSRSIIGLSKLGRLVYKLESNSELNTGKYLFIIGRQHPTEVPGAIALMAFTDTLYSDTELAKEFRRQFGIVGVPNINPDGVALGYWRSSTGLIDLNDDWGDFTQVETANIARELRRFASGDQLELFIDFHSTDKDEMYTQPFGSSEWPSKFTNTWMTRLKERLPDYDFRHWQLSDSYNGTANYYVRSTYQANTIIFEAGNDDSTSNTVQEASAFAEEIMRAMLNK